MARIRDIEGLNDTYARKLEGIGIRNVDALLEHAANPDRRKHVAERTGIHHLLLLRWAHQGDFLRISGIGAQYANLLETAGVSTLSDLARAQVDQLYGRMSEINQQQRLVRQLPRLETVETWVKQARCLPRRIY